MSKILSIDSNQSLLKTHQLMLEVEGHKVVSASNFLEVTAACNQKDIDLIIVGHTIAANVKRAITATIRQNEIAAPILELFLISPEIPDAEYALMESGPEQLIGKIRQIFRNGRS